MTTLKGRLILIADDERYITTTLASKLRAAGATVIVANDGAEALALAREHLPELILSDYQMPILDGLEFCKQLATEIKTATIPIAMLTARGFKIPPSDLAATNVRVVLSKPFSVREVLDTLQTLAATLAA